MASCLQLVICLSLYVIVALSWWKPKPGTTWQWQLGGDSIDTSYDVDMYGKCIYSCVYIFMSIFERVLVEIAKIKNKYLLNRCGYV